MSVEDPHAGAQLARPRRFWVIELWEENREVFKELVKHILIFGVFIASLSGIHHLLKLSSLPENELGLLNKLHFYAYVIALVIFAGSFIIKVVIFEFRGIRP